MKEKPILRLAALAILCGVLALQPALAEDTKGKWQFGLGLSYYATTDYIRSNSDVIVTEEVAGQGGEGIPTVKFTDDRPDQNMLNEPSARDNFKWDFSASYGLTRWLALEMAAGYMKTAVGNIEYFTTDREKFIGGGTPSGGNNASVCGPSGNGLCFNYPGTAGTGASDRFNEFIPVGDLTEIPLQLSALVRFRPESPLDPYIGLGIGYIFTNIETGEEFNDRASAVEALNITVGFGGEVDIGDNNRRQETPGYHPAPLQAEVNDAFEFHAVGGIDYYFNEHMSMYVDARYIWSDAHVDITTDGAHQVRLSAYYPGRLQQFTEGSVASPIYWEDRGFTSPGPNAPPQNCTYDDNGMTGISCAGDGLLATEDSNGNGTLDPGAGEGTGKLYFYKLGPNPDDINGRWTCPDPQHCQAEKVIDCPTCSWANNFYDNDNDPSPSSPPIPVLDTEDANNNRYADRFFNWGVDVCSLPDAATNPICAPADIRALPQYIWPGGCSLTLSDPTTPNPEAEGCPRPPGIPRFVATGGNPWAAPAVSQTPADDVSDVHVIQGGEIKLGGFSLGVGFKFTF